MPKIKGVWLCDICGNYAEYHRCENSGHEYYCQSHWAQGDLTIKQLRRGYGTKGKKNKTKKEQR